MNNERLNLGYILYVTAEDQTKAAASEKRMSKLSIEAPIKVPIGPPAVFLDEYQREEQARLWGDHDYYGGQSTKGKTIFKRDINTGRLLPSRSILTRDIQKAAKKIIKSIPRYA